MHAWSVSIHGSPLGFAPASPVQMDMLQKMESGMGCPDSHAQSLAAKTSVDLFPGHAGACGNKWEDGLPSTADTTSGLQLGSAKVLRSLRNFLIMDRPEHHSIDRLKERGVETGSGRHSTV